MMNKICKDKKQVSHRHGSLNDWWGQKQGIFYIPETATDPKGQYPRYKEGLPLTLWISEKFKSHFSSKSEKSQGLRGILRNPREPKEILSTTKNL